MIIERLNERTHFIKYPNLLLKGDAVNIIGKNRYYLRYGYKN